jgi:Tfp pilus assembly protein PilE
MRLTRLRFTVRRMMIAVAVVAILIVVSPLRQRWVSYRRTAMEHAFLAKESHEKAELIRAAGRREHPEIRRVIPGTAEQ